MIKKAEFSLPVQEVIANLSVQIKKWVINANKTGAVVGVSGGVGSAVVASLCAIALRTNNVHGVFLPGYTTNEESNKNVKALINKLNIIHEELNIYNITQKIESEMWLCLGNYNFGNLQSEVRAVVLSRYAAKHNLLIMGTGNHDEGTVLGYFTKRGDGAVDNNILGNIPKRLVYKLAEALDVPREPTAELWEGQTDEKELGFNYEEAENVWTAYKHYAQISAYEIKKYDLEKNAHYIHISKISKVPLKTVNKIFDMHYRNKHKNELPPTGKVKLIYV